MAGWIGTFGNTYRRIFVPGRCKGQFLAAGGRVLRPYDQDRDGTLTRMDRIGPVQVLLDRSPKPDESGTMVAPASADAPASSSAEAEAGPPPEKPKRKRKPRRES